MTTLPHVRRKLSLRQEVGSRLGDVLAYIKERQDQQPMVKSNSDKNGYVKRARGPGRRKDFMNDPAVIERRKAALARLDAAE